MYADDIQMYFLFDEDNQKHADNTIKKKSNLNLFVTKKVKHIFYYILYFLFYFKYCKH